MPEQVSHPDDAYVPAAFIGEHKYTAFLFDMDGVVTDTARLHIAAWRRLWEEALPALGESGFSDEDYQEHIDGRARIDGVTGFLTARGIELPLGDEDDAPGSDTAWALARRKDALFAEELDSGGAVVFDSTVRVLTSLRAAGVPTALVTASRNAERIMTAAGITHLFDACVDGVVAAELALPGKPDPAVFIEAARLVNADPGRAVVVEDAQSGVRAGKAGGFGLVIGIDRGGNAQALADSGADIVVTDLAELAIHPSDPSCLLCRAPRDQWRLDYVGTEAAHEGTREALMTLGNGYQAVRGAIAEAAADTIRYPGVYVAGVYNRLASEVNGQRREDESMVNLPNWLPMTFRAEGGNWLPAEAADVGHEHRRLDIRAGVLSREGVVTDERGRRTRFRQRRLVSMARPHRAAMDLTIIPENWSGRIEVYSAIDGAVRNANVAEFVGLADQHLTEVRTGTEAGALWLSAQTTQSRIRVAVAARHTVRRGGDDVGAQRSVEPSQASVAEHLILAAATGEEVTVEKSVAVFTSRDRGHGEASAAAVQELATSGDFTAEHRAAAAAWAQLWRRCQLELDGVNGARLAVNLHLFHLVQTLSPHTIDLDVGVPARGLHGEGYRGHIFWDEMFVLPYLNLRLPELSRSLLNYRYRRLGRARDRAAAQGLKGALFPWQSGSDGREETPHSFYNPRSGRWMRDNSRLQYHVNLAVAYNVWRYWETTGDLGFLSTYGAEMLIDVARFWASLATYDSASDRYDVRGVMGPDEFHDGYPDRPGEGIDNSCYVNVMVSWVLTRAVDVYRVLGAERGGQTPCCGVTDDEVELWQHMAARVRLEFLHSGVPSQFAGYGELAELDWAGYRDRYGDIGRLDLILEAEDDTTNRYQASKQADVLMLLYLFTAEELTSLIRGLGYPFEPETIPATVDHYLARTSHGSTLSRVAHTWVLARSNRAGSWSMFTEALASDLADTQGGTTREGVHLGAMAGTLDILQRCYTGLDTRCGALWLHPALPAELASLSFAVLYRDHWLSIRVSHREITVSAAPGGAPPVTIVVDDTRYELGSDESVTITLNEGRKVPADRDLQPKRGLGARA